MTKLVRVEPTNVTGQTVLDMRVSSSEGEDLAEEIRESVAHSQMFIQTTLPDCLIVTQKQFVSLQPWTEEMHHTTDRMFWTPHAVMEVVIDRDLDIVPEIEQVIQDTEELEQEGHDHVDYPTDQPSEP